MSMGKKKGKLYLDLDDTVKDTERYIRRVLKTNNIGESSLCGSIYNLIGSDSYAGNMVRECLKEWDVIPYKSIALDGIKLLKTEYDVVFCSAYTFEREAELKKEFARENGCDIILCGEDNRFKDKVDMSDAIFIDDRSDILIRSNAKVKYEILNPYFFDIYAERDDRTLVVDWHYLMGTLISKGVGSGGIINEKLGRLIYSGV